MAAFTYQGPVRGQERPRFGQGRPYESKKAKAYKDALRAAYKAQDGTRFGEDVPLVVYIHAFRPMPKDTPKRVLAIPWTVKPDADNIGKAVLDALNGVAWKDDKQVVRVMVWKHNRTRDVVEGLRVFIEDAREVDGGAHCELV